MQEQSERSERRARTWGPLSGVCVGVRGAGRGGFIEVETTGAAVIRGAHTREGGIFELTTGCGRFFSVCG